MQMPNTAPIAILKLLSHYEIIHSPLSQVNSERIYAGSVNHNYKVIDGDNRFLLKLFKSNKILPIDRRRVFRLQEELAILALAPQPLFLSEDNLIYCEKWIDYHPYSVAENLMMLAEALNYVHTTYISAPSLSLVAHWSAYWLKFNPAKQGQITQKTFETMQNKWIDYQRQYSEEFVLCHNDLHISHVCDYHGPILDWEYAGLGCRYFDIASCCIINQLNDSQTNVLCQNYASLVDADAHYVKSRVGQVTEFVHFTNDLWISALDIGDNNIFS